MHFKNGAGWEKMKMGRWMVSTAETGLQTCKYYFRLMMYHIACFVLRSKTLKNQDLPRAPLEIHSPMG